MTAGGGGILSGSLFSFTVSRISGIASLDSFFLRCWFGTPRQDKRKCWFINVNRKRLVAFGKCTINFQAFSICTKVLSMSPSVIPIINAQCEYANENVWAAFTFTAQYWNIEWNIFHMNFIDVLLRLLLTRVCDGWWKGLIRVDCLWMCLRQVRGHDWRLIRRCGLEHARLSDLRPTGN